MPSVTIIGVGRVGGALEIAFRGTEFQVVSLRGRADPLDGVVSDIVIIATPDKEIANVAAGLTGNIDCRTVVLHTSGSLSSGELSILADSGNSVGSMHPLVSFSSAEIGAKRFSGAYFCVEGDAKAVDTANAIVELLGGHSFEIPSANKALYHAAAVTSCGHVTALIDMAFSMMESAGVDAETSEKILEPLIRGTIDNIYEQGTAASLTGTFARADARGLMRQLVSFKDRLADEEVEIYLNLAHRSLELARRQGVDVHRIADVDEVISVAKSKLQ